MVVLGADPYHMSTFIVGKWNPEVCQFDFDTDKIAKLNNRKSTLIKHCFGCPVQLHCGGYCLGETVNETGCLDGQNEVRCSAIKELFSVLGECEPYEYLHP